MKAAIQRRSKTNLAIANGIGDGAVPQDCTLRREAHGRQRSSSRETPRKLKVIVTFSEMNNLSVCRQHGELPTVDVTAIRQGTGLS